jgi:hypothetical protein
LDSRCRSIRAEATSGPRFPKRPGQFGGPKIAASSGYSRLCDRLSGGESKAGFQFLNSEHFKTEREATGQKLIRWTGRTRWTVRDPRRSEEFCDASMHSQGAGPAAPRNSTRNSPAAPPRQCLPASGPSHRASSPRLNGTRQLRPRRTKQPAVSTYDWREIGAGQGQHTGDLDQRSAFSFCVCGFRSFFRQLRTRSRKVWKPKLLHLRRRCLTASPCEHRPRRLASNLGRHILASQQSGGVYLHIGDLNDSANRGVPYNGFKPFSPIPRGNDFLRQINQERN